MINKEKLIKKLNSMKLDTVAISETEQMRWTGKIPEDVDIVAPFKNVFISEKNLKIWIDMVNGEEIPDEPKIESVNLKTGLPSDISDFSKKDIARYALKHLEIEVSTRTTKEKMIKQIEEQLNGL